MTGLHKASRSLGRRATILALVGAITACSSGSDTLTYDDPSASLGDADRFATLPVGSALPDDAECAARVRPEEELRATNEAFNQTRGRATRADADYSRYSRVTGDFVGTTGEILQWAACKWGIDEDVVRAQAAKESYWLQTNVGDFTTDPAICAPGHPIGADGRPGECPESIGVMQLRRQYFERTIDDAARSTAYNLDLAYAVWRTCFEGDEEWLDTAERGRPYEAGDMWGCVGRWFSGRWYTEPSVEYIAAVQDYLAERIWESADFQAFSG